MNQPDRYSRWVWGAACAPAWQAPCGAGVEALCAAASMHSTAHHRPRVRRAHPGKRLGEGRAQQCAASRGKCLQASVPKAGAPCCAPPHSPVPHPNPPSHRFVLQEGQRKVSYKADTKLANAGTFTIMHEDHTMGNLVRMQLHLDKQVVFAGYRIPHPLDPKMLIKVQTGGVKSPVQAVEHALEDLRSEVQTLQNEFDQAFLRARSDPMM